MKRRLALLPALFGLMTATAHAQSMGQPGYYGYIELGGYSQPPLLISNAVMGNPGVYTGSPVYMNVPPEHAHGWSRYCSLYGACDWVVYFVDNNWYESVYVPGFNSGMVAYPPAYVAPYYGPPRHYRPPPDHVRPPPPRPSSPNTRPPAPRPPPQPSPHNPGGTSSGSRSSSR